MKISQTTQFRKDVRKQKKRGKDVGKLMEAVDLLVSGGPVPEKFRDHALAGNWNGWRDCHIEPDWLLIYKPLTEELILARTGTHADLF
jgi:mRNA interferase YafQ